MKFDPKLVKKISQTKLIQASKLMNIKNAEKVTKENLIPAFIKAVEAVPESEQDTLDAKVVDAYNDVVKTLGLDKDEESAEEAKPPVEKPKKAQAKKEKKEEEPRYSRFDALSDTFKEMKKGGKIEDLVAKAFKKHTDAGGGGTSARMRFFGKGTLKTLVALGVAELTEDGYRIVK